MMSPLIRLEYDDSEVSDKAVEEVSKAIRDIVSETTGISDVFVYANTAKIKIQVAPIEIFVEMSAKKIKDEDGLMNEIKTKLSYWKSANGFDHPINLTLIPMNWKVEIGI
jgi:hypothetical protein